MIWHRQEMDECFNSITVLTLKSIIYCWAASKAGAQRERKKLDTVSANVEVWFLQFEGAKAIVRANCSWGGRWWRGDCLSTCCERVGCSVKSSLTWLTSLCIWDLLPLSGSDYYHSLLPVMCLFHSVRTSRRSGCWHICLNCCSKWP